VPAVPILGIVACLYLMMGLPTSAWIRFAVWLAIGLGIYYAYGYTHSRLHVGKEPESR
jgi:APA family basic amino acid/polyamine antiporter